MGSGTAVTAYIALGANLGERAASIDAALAALEATPGVRVVRRSSLLENAAVGGPRGSPPFLNGVAEVETTLRPHALLGRLLEIEHDLGRQRRERWEPRVIDLDLILFGSQVIDTAELRVPHPLVHQRRFVLEPLAEIAPDVVHPVSGLTVRKMLADLENTSPRLAFQYIDADVRCVGCGYNLRGLPLRHACPECGLRTAESVDEDSFQTGTAPLYDDDPRLGDAAAIAERCNCAAEAVLLVADAVAFMSVEWPERDGRSLDASRDFSAHDFVMAFREYVRECFWNDGAAATEILHLWGLHTSEDVGRVMFGLVEAGWLMASEKDRPSDFDGLFVTRNLLKGGAFVQGAPVARARSTS